MHYYQPYLWLLTIIPTRSSVLQREVLVLKLGAVDALSASAVVIGEVSSLAHEAWNDAME